MISFFSKLKWLLIFPVILLGIVWFSQIDQRETLPVLIELPNFNLKTQDDISYSKQNLLGHATLINFVFTSCPTVCPLLTQTMKSLVSNSSNPEIRFVSISVDPETDQPAILKKYGEKFGVDWSRWTFLTGTLDAISDVVVKGFKVVLIRNKMKEKAEETKDLFDITHGEHFVLVDKKGNIRAYRMIATEQDKSEVIQILEKLNRE